MSTRTFVIAECGSCHDGSLEKATRLIEAAASAGCQAAKFQYWSSAERLAERRRAPDYLDVYRRYQVPVAWFPILKRHCDERSVELMATTYLPEDVAVIAPFVQRFKVSSFEASDREHVQAHVVYDKPILVSVGMLSRNAVDRIAEIIQPDGALLLCTSAYPAPLDEVNLRLLQKWAWADWSYKRTLQIQPGYSDHTGVMETGGLAVAAGAEIVEVHAKLLDTDPVNPDAGSFALTPWDLDGYVSFIRRVDAMLGDGHKRQMPSEEPMLKYKVTA